MRLRNFLIVVEDLEKSKQFYHELFGMQILLEQEGNIILTDGLVLQEKRIWQKTLGEEIIEKNNACELYFEERNIEVFLEKMKSLYPSVVYVQELTTCSWGQKLVRFYDPDGHLIEVRTPMN